MLLDADESRDVVRHLKVKAFPTTLCIINNQVEDICVGGGDEDLHSFFNSSYQKLSKYLYKNYKVQQTLFIKTNLLRTRLIYSKVFLEHLNIIFHYILFLHKVNHNDKKGAKIPCL